MRKETVNYGEILAVVRSDNRRTNVVEAQYMQRLRFLYPLILEYEGAVADLVVPNVTPTLVTNLPPEERKLWDEYRAQHVRIGDKYSGGRAYTLAAESVSFCLSRCESLVGVPFKFDPAGEVDIRSAMEFYLEGDKDDELWIKIAQAAKRVNEPLTLVHQQPEEALTEAQRKDPLSENVIANGTSMLVSTSSS